jgi:Xaa-Pro dipeptidase
VTIPLAATEPLPAFSDDEYRARWAAVQEAMDEYGVDAVAATYKIHVEYLTATWGSQFWVAPVIVPRRGEPAYLVRLFDEERVRHESRVARIESYFDRDDAVPRWADLLRSMGLATARLGLELDNLDLTHRDVTALQELLPGLVVVDVSDLIPRLMAVKSAAEVAVMRVAARRSRLAVQAFSNGLVAGVAERDLRAAMAAAVTADGSEELRGGVAFGATTALPHAGDGATRLGPDDVAYTECSGYHLGYCATICRTAVVGRHRAAERLYDVARRAVDAVERALRPGATAGAVDAACRRVVEDAGFGGTFRHRTGYAVGLRANGRLNLSLKPGASDLIDAGMTFHTPIILIEPGVVGVACSETFLVTDQGGEPLAGIDRDLIRR